MRSISALIVLAALAVAPACQVMGARMSEATSFDFEDQAIGSDPGDFLAYSTGWAARVEARQAASGQHSLRLYVDQAVQHTPPGDFAITLDAAPFRGKVVRVSGALRVEENAESSSTVRLFVHVERQYGLRGLEDAMEDAPVRATEWAPTEIIGAVAADAVTITIGACVTGKGPFHLDDLAIEALRDMGPDDSRLLERVSERQIANPDVQVVHVRSEALSRFFGREVFVDAGVIVPPGLVPGEVAVCYQVPSLSGSWVNAFTEGAEIALAMRGTYPRMLYVYLESRCAQGDHGFADSVNDGPWGEALVNELIPAIESRFLGGRAPSARYVTGHGSGGWSALWLQTSYPHFFNGAWATAPDAIDFRSFLGVDIYMTRNLYQDARGRENQLVRSGNSWKRSVREFAQAEMLEQPLGGQLYGYEAVFSPRGDDGRPLRLFDRQSGAIDPRVAQAWRKYDIGAILREKWATLGPKLTGRLHVWCGTLDTQRREGAVKLLKQDLERLGADAEVLLIEERDYDTLFDPHPVQWPFGMRARIHREMAVRTAALARP